MVEKKMGKKNVLDVGIRSGELAHLRQMPGPAHHWQHSTTHSTAVEYNIKREEKKKLKIYTKWILRDPTSRRTDLAFSSGTLSGGVLEYDRF